MTDPKPADLKHLQEILEQALEQIPEPKLGDTGDDVAYRVFAKLAENPTPEGKADYWEVISLANKNGKFMVFAKHPELLDGLQSSQREEFFRAAANRGDGLAYLRNRQLLDRFPEASEGTMEALRQSTYLDSKAFTNDVPALFSEERLREHPEEREMLATAYVEHFNLASSSTDVLVSHLKNSQFLLSSSPESKAKIMSAMLDRLLLDSDGRELKHFKEGVGGFQELEPSAETREHLLHQAMENTKGTAPISLKDLYVKELGAAKANELLKKAAYHDEAGSALSEHLDDTANHNRFAILENLPTGALYSIANTSRDSLFPSSYRGVMERLQKRLDASHQNIPDILDEGQQKTIPHFLLQVAASSQEPEKMLKYIPEEKMPELLRGMVAATSESSKREVVRNGSGLVEWMERLKGIKPEWAQILEHEVRNKAENAPTDKEKSLFRKIAALRESSFSGTVGDRDFFEKSYNQYVNQMSYSKRVEHERMVDNTGAVRIRYVFHHDDDKGDHNDAQNSYNSFMAAHTGWKKEDHENFVVLSKDLNGVPVYLYANKPGKENMLNGQKEIEKLVASEQSASGESPKEAYFTMVSDRGHIYFFNETLDYIGSKTPIVFNGACFGSDTIGQIKSRSPEAQVISTKGEGAMAVNEPFLAMITEDIANAVANKRDLYWKTMRQNHTTPSDERARDYTFPDQNPSMQLLDLLKLKENSNQQANIPQRSSSFSR